MPEGKSEKEDGKRKVRVIAHQKIEFDQTLELSEEDYQKLINHEEIDVPFGADAWWVLDVAIDPRDICDAEHTYTDVEIIPVEDDS